MKILRQFIVARRMIKTLVSIDQHLEKQNQLLARLADHFTPQLPPPPEDLAKQDSVTFLDQIEKGKVLDYIEKTIIDNGRAPTEDEIIQYLAQEATTDLIEHLKGPEL